MRLSPSSTLHVLVATPSGVSGKGGIDRIMESLRGELEREERADLCVGFAASRGPGSVAFSPFYLGSFLCRMLVLRAMGRLDLVHINLASHGSTFRKLQIARLARLIGVPYVLHLHSGDYARFWTDKRPALSRQIRAMFDGAARTVVLGRVWRDFVASRAPEIAERIVIVPNASARPTLPHVGGGDEVHILFLGRLGRNKGVPELTAALARMGALPNWHATIAGDGDVEATRRAAIETGLADRIDIPGWVGGERVSELIASADILVLPSFSENLPLSVIEGMASGLAVVATPVGAVEDIITDGETGLLVQPGDVDGLAEALTRLVGDAQLRQRLGAAALAFHREKLDLEAFAAALHDVWVESVA